MLEIHGDLFLKALVFFRNLNCFKFRVVVIPKHDQNSNIQVTKTFLVQPFLKKRKQKLNN